MYTFYKNDVNIYIFKFSGYIKDNEVVLFSNDLNNLILKEVPFYIILDILYIKNFDYNFFNNFNDLFKDKDKIKKYFKGTAIIIEKYIGILNNILRIKRPMMDTKIFNNYDDAIEYLNNII